MTDDLFALALDLIDTRKPKLKQIALRKAVSAAYYGLFHALLTMLADTIAGKGKSRTPEYAAIYRIPDHGPLLRTLLDNKDRDVQAVASILKSLQEQRHTADYNPLPFKMGRQAARDLISDAKKAASAIAQFKPQQRLAITAALLSAKRRSP